MNKGEQIYQIRQALKKLFSSTESASVESDTEMEKKMFNDYDLEGGGKMSCSSDTLEVGSDVFGINLEGNQYPLDNGDYKLTDGRTVSVEDNKVKSISEPAMIEESPMTDADMEKTEKVEMEKTEKEKVMEEVEESKDVKVELVTEERIAKLEEVIAKLMMTIDEISKAHEEMMGNMKMYSSEPGAESIVMEKGIGSSVDPKEFSKRKNISEIEEIREIIKKNRKENNNTKL
jgi:hypothetical protein